MKEFQLKFIINKHTVRSLKILNALQRNSYLSLNELAEETSSSDRTILTDIQRMREYFSTTIDLKSTNFGYNLKILSSEDYIEKKKALLNEEPLFKILESIFFNDCFSLSEWSESLYTTESTLNKQLLSIQKILAEYQIVLSRSPINFIGNEINIRKFFHDFYYESDITPHTVLPSSVIQDLSSKLIQNSFFNEYSSISYTEFNYIIFITFQRIATGNRINDFPSSPRSMNNDLLVLKKKAEQSIVKLMAEEYFNISLPEAEVSYLYIQLITRRSLISVTSEKAFIDNFDFCEYSKRSAIAYSKKILIPDNEINKSSIFFESFFLSVKIKQLIAPILNQNLSDVTNYVKKLFPEQYSTTYDFISTNLSEPFGLSERNTNDISANLVLLTDSMNNFYWGQKHNIAILLEGNRYITENIRASAQRYLGKHCSLYFPDATKISQEYFSKNKINLIVTNYSDYLTNFNYDIDIILFEMIPTKKDWSNLFKILNPSLVRKLKLT